jgi:HEAT repeat protein
LKWDWLLSARCLADDVRVDPEVWQEVREDLNGLLRGKETIGPLLGGAASALNSWRETSYQPFALEALHQAMEDEEWRMRLAAAWTLGPEEAEAMEKVIPGLVLAPDEEWRVRLAAAGALDRIGEATWESVPDLRETLRDRDWHVRLAAARMLGRKGKAAQEVALDLQQALGDEEKAVRSTAAEALEQLVPRLPAEERLSWLAEAQRLFREGLAEVREPAWRLLRTLAQQKIEAEPLE